MGKASLTIAVSGDWNGKALERAEKSLFRMQAAAVKAAGGADAALFEAGEQAAKLGGKLHNAGVAMQEIGTNATTYITAPLTMAGAASFKLASDFESSMSRVKGALNDPTADMESLRQLALDMGADTVFSASEASSAMEELAKGGLTAAQIEGGALATTMDLAAAGSMQLSEAASTVVQSMGAFELSADQSSQAANALAGAAAASSADVADLTQGLSQVSAQAHSAGWSIQDTTAVLAAFADAGIKGSDAGTSLKTMLQRLAAPTDEAASLMEELGIEIRDENGNMLDAASVAEELSSKLGGLSSAQKDAAMQTIFGSDASRAALIMTNQGRAGIEKYTAATNDQTAAQRLAESQMGESERALENMKGAVETAAIEVGTALAPAVVDVAEVVSDAAEAFSELDDETKSMIVGAAALSAGFGPVLIAGGKVVSTVGDMTVAFGRMQQKAAVAGKAVEGTTAKTKLLNAASVAAKPGLMALGGVALVLVAKSAYDAYDYMSDLSGATDGLRSAVAGATSPIDSAAKSVDGLASSGSGAAKSISSLLDAQAKWAQSLQERNSDTQASIATLDSYAGTIDSLAGKSDLTAQQQAELKNAVDGLNESCGTSYTVAQDAGGAYQVMGDGAAVAKDEVLKLIDAQKAQVQIDAARESWTEATKQQADAADTLAAAQAEVNRVQSEYGPLVKAGTMSQRDYDNSLRAANADLNNAKSAYDEASYAVENFSEKMTIAEMATGDAADEYASFVSSNQSLQAGLAQSGQSLTEFRDMLELTGVSTESLTSLTETELAQLGISYDGSLASIVRKLSEFGITCTTEGAYAGRNFANGISSQAQAALTAAASVTGLTEGELRSMAESAGYHGSEGIIEYANGIKSKACESQSAAATAVEYADSGLSGGNSYGIGQEYGMGYANGIASNAVKRAIASGTSALVDAAGSSLRAAQKSGSPSRVAMGYGDDYGEGYGIGIGNSVKYASMGAASIVEAANDAIENASRADAFSAEQSFSNKRNYSVSEYSAPSKSSIGTEPTKVPESNFKYAELLAMILDALTRIESGMTEKFAAAFPSNIKVNNVELFRLIKAAGL